MIIHQNYPAFLESGLQAMEGIHHYLKGFLYTKPEIERITLA